ncbi:hypothetical protein ACNHKD_18925 [Methylocystis sp. JAN1]|uniref:hypothetical protein n=1 Tax=Methylocystis sp. JAN1 TaxID=3397211 RepID=UPI003FA3244C
MAGGLEHFSLLGGPFFRLGARLGLVRRRSDTIPMGLALGGLCWLVLVALAFARGGAQDLFTLPAIAIHARLLLAIPLLFVAETALDEKLEEFVTLLVRSGIAGPKALPELKAEADRLSKRTDSWAPDAVSLAAALAVTFVGRRAGVPAEIETGRALHALPLAGAWYWFFCLPLFRFLLFRWICRLLLWWSLLGRLAKMELDLSAAHPDGAGGLGYLETVHTRFTPFALAISVTVAATFAEEIAMGEETLSDIYPALAATLLLNAALFLAPLCLFLFKLRACQEKGLREYAVLGARYVRAFEQKWIAGAPDGEPLLGTADLQSLADLANSVEVVRKMRLAPISIRLLATIGVAASLPLLPLLLFEYPLADLAKMLFSKLAGL